MDVAQMGCRARKKSRKWHFPDFNRCILIDTLENPVMTPHSFERSREPFTLLQRP